MKTESIFATLVWITQKEAYVIAPSDNPRAAACLPPSCRLPACYQFPSKSGVFTDENKNVKIR